MKAWADSEPHAPANDWYKDFGSFLLCGTGEYPKTVTEERHEAVRECALNECGGSCNEDLCVGRGTGNRERRFNDERCRVFG